jgi:iron complex outermembrane receptor protein
VNRVNRVSAAVRRVLRARTLAAVTGAIAIQMAAPAVADQSSAAAASLPATAESGNGLQEITVTANRRSENLQSVPIAISAVTADQFAQANITSTADIGMLVPGLNYQVGELNASPYIRGVGTSAANAGADNSVQTYVDGVLISGFNGGLQALNNVQQIEVDKGPQGTLFGRNTTGGVVNITTKTPSQQFHSDGSVSYGNYNTLAISEYLTGGITSNLAADVAAYYSNQSDGWGKNVFTGSDVYKENDKAIRTKWVLDAGDSDTFTLTADYSVLISSVMGAETVIPGTYSNWGPGTTTAAERPDMAAGVASGAILPTFVVGLPATHPPGSPYNVDVTVDPYSRWWQWGESLKWRHDFGPASLNYIGAYRDYREDLIWSPSPSAGVGQIAGWGNGTTELTQELQLLSAPSSPIHWVGGVFFLHDSVKYVHPFFIEGSSINGVTIPGAGFTRVNFYGDQSTLSYAPYGQVTFPIPFIPKTDLTLGARYTHDNKAISGLTTLQGGPLYLGFLPPADEPEINGGTISGKDTFTKTTVRAALDHHFTDDVMGYVSFNTGFKSGGYNMIPPSPQAYNPETLTAWEAGVKTEFLDHRIRLNTSAFYYDWSDLQVTVYENTSAVTVNAAKARLYGLDLDVQAKPTDELSLTAGIELLKDYFTSYPDAIFNVPQSQAQGGGTIGVVESAKGNKLPYAPDATMNVTADYRVPLPVGTLGFDISYYHSTGFRTTADNFIGQSAYQLLNARAEWALPDGHTTLSVWGKNLTDEIYATQIRANNNPGGFQVQTLAAPRTYGVSARYAF